MPRPPDRAGDPQVTPPAARQSRTILVVDDERAILDLLAEILADEGFVVHRRVRCAPGGGPRARRPAQPDSH